MTSLAARIRRRLFGVSTDDVRFEKRGLRLGDPTLRARLEGIAEVFLVGYHVVLDNSDGEKIAAAIAESVDEERRGFAFEGAGMSLALLDAVTPFGGGRLGRFVTGAGAGHKYMIYIGAGWAIARLGSWRRRLTRLDPLAQGLAADGLGFHNAFFKVGETVRRAQPPRGLEGLLARGYDQGVGRCLWFVECGDVAEVEATIASFAAARHGDLWSGVGLACTYAGGGPRATLERLRDAATREGHAAAFAQGSAFALMARADAGLMAPHNELACAVIWGRPVDEVVALARAAGEGLEGVTAADAPYETWRLRIQQKFSTMNNSIGLEGAIGSRHE